MSCRMPMAPVTLPSGSRRAEALRAVGMISPDALRGLRRALRVTPQRVLPKLQTATPISVCIIYGVSWSMPRDRESFHCIAAITLMMLFFEVGGKRIDEILVHTLWNGVKAHVPRSRDARVCMTKSGGRLSSVKGPGGSGWST